MCSTGYFSDKKYTRQNAVLTKEKLVKTEARSWHLPPKSMTIWAQEAQIFNDNSAESD
jgi:hypothetical protein